MRRTIRTILYNGDETYASQLRGLLLGVDGISIVADLDDAAMLVPAVTQFPCDLLVVHLDPAPEAVIGLLSQVAGLRADLAIFAISECSDGQVILTAMRAGVREYLTKPVNPEELDAAVERIAQQVASRREPGHIISVMSSVGGGGATTVATNLATELAHLCADRDQKVALVDLDYRFGQVATMLDVQPKFSIADLCDTPERPDPQLITRAMVKHATGLHVLTRPTSFAQAELITAAHCASVLTGLQDLYQFVVVDGPTRFDPGARSVLDLASIQFMVIQLLVPSVRNVQRILDALSADGYNLARMKLVCNRVSKDSGYLEPEHVERSLNRDLFHSLPDEWKTVSASVNMGVPLLKSAPKSRIRQAFQELAEAVHAALGSESSEAEAPTGAVEGHGKKGGGLWGKLMRTT
jgi:pilus assembly protein CpaE